MLGWLMLDEEFYQCRVRMGWLRGSGRLSGARFVVCLEPIEDALLEFGMGYG